MIQFLKQIIFFSLLLFAFSTVLQSVEPERNVKEIVQSTLNSPHEDLLPIKNQLRILGFLTLVALIPFGIVMLTSFTRISIIFHFLRQALGFQQVPSNQIVIGLSLILTAYVMHPVINEIQEKSLEPYFTHRFKNNEQVSAGVKTEEGILLESAWAPLRDFLLKHTREDDLLLFLNLEEVPAQTNQNVTIQSSQQSLDLPEIPWYSLVPAFVLSELRIAFMMGFLLFLPFLIIDMVVASILMSMGMMMLPAVLISTPFKLLLFILVDGWKLIIEQIVNTF